MSRYYFYGYGMAYYHYKPNSALYHYTDTNAFLNIIKSKKIWLTDSASLNDPREIDLGMEHFSNAIDQYRDGTIHGVNKGSLHELYNDIHDARKRSVLYACCFSTEGDSLPMWRLYTNEGSGVVIGFRPTALSSTPGRVLLVRYDDDRIEDYYRQIVLKSAQNISASKSLERAIMAGEIFALLSAVKHKSWSYEKEVRIIYNQRLLRPDDPKSWTKYTGIHENGDLMEWTEPLTREGKDGAVHYFAFPYGKSKGNTPLHSMSIESVTIGPNCTMSVEDVEKILTMEGFQHFNVLKSECQYR